MDYLVHDLLDEETSNNILIQILQDKLSWEDGKKTAGSYASKVKNNLQFNRNSELSKKLAEIIKNKTLKQLLKNSKIFLFSSLTITFVCISYAFLNISDGLYNNLTSIFTLLILGLSIVLNSLSLIQEQRIFWAKKYKAIFIEMLIISSLLLFSFIFLRFNTLILSIGIISANIARFSVSTIIANEY